MTRLRRLMLLTLPAASLSAPNLRAQATAAALPHQVFTAESAFAASMAQRDARAFARFVADEAIFFGDTTVLRGKAAVIEGWKPYFAGATPPFSWKPDVIEVLSSGTLALSSGPVFEPSGQKVATFSSIWRREPDGAWRIIFDQGAPICNCRPSK
jgi:ketosteroid isomerase-like protein